MNAFHDLMPQPSTLLQETQILLLSPQTFLKLQFFLHAGQSEVCGFGITCRQNPLYLRDFVTLPQRVSPVSTCVETVAVADHVDAMALQGLSCEQAARIWICLRPGSCAQPSRNDERSFEKAAGHCDWSVLLILARSGQSFVRLQYRAGPKSRLLLPLRVYWSAWSQTLSESATHYATQQAWREEYQCHIHHEPFLQAIPPASLTTPMDTEPATAPVSPLLSALIPIEPEPVE